MAKRLRFTIEGMTYHATLQENGLAGMIARMCPFTMDCTRSGEHEYYAALPEKAAAKDCPSTTEGHRNGLYYFEGWNALSLVFKDCNTAPYQIHPIGDFEEDIAAVIEKLGRNVYILCETEQEKMKYG